MTPEQIQDAYYAANKALHEAEQEQEEELDEIKARHARLASAEKTEVYKKHRDKLEKLQHEARKAKEAFDELKVAQAVKVGWRGHPVGTVLCQWESAGKYGRGSLVIKAKGIVEVCTKDTKFGRNSSQWRKPEIGTAFLRSLKKDGTPSLVIARDLWGMWLPEGQKPEGAR